LWYHLGDPSPDGAERVCIGATHGGDVFVVATPGVAQRSNVMLLSHEEDFEETGAWGSLESFLAARIAEHRERMQEEFPDDEAEWATDLDPYLTK
jgi:hypothetical protein